MIKRSLIYLVSHFLLCTLIFLCIQKIIFIFYNWNHGGSACSFADWLQIYWHGMPLDFATSGYLTIIPFLIILIHNLYPRFMPNRSLTIYNGFIAILLSIVTLADTSLYEFWEFKLDATVFFYLNDPKNAFASVTLFYVFLRLVAIILLAGVYYWILQLPVRKIDFRQTKTYNKVIALAAILVAGGCIFAAIRGLRIWPNTPGRAFYSKTAFHNHAALNPLFNIAYTSAQRKSFDKQFNFFTEEKRQQIYAPLFPTQETTTELLLNNPRPNILFVVLEGFGAVFIEELGGMKEVGPNISRLSRESINFTQCYCSSFRTDRGIVSLLSGYPGQPTSSIMRYSHKIQSLPGLPKTLKEHGYETQVLYTSDMTFFNMSDYFISAGHDKLVSQDDFPLSDRTTKWGVPDHIAFEWLYQDIQEKQKKGNPWYTTFLTISSHTPFDVPYHKLKDEKLNAFAYTDSCFGDFIDRLKQTPAWDNLLIVCTADHGFNHQEIASPDFPHIPCIFLGGAIKAPAKIDKIICQTDLPSTILGQLAGSPSMVDGKQAYRIGIQHDEFIFSRNVMADTYTYPFAFNTFNNGFNFRDTTGVTVYDNNANKALYGEDKQREEKGKAILQTLYDDLNSR